MPSTKILASYIPGSFVTENGSMCYSKLACCGVFTVRVSAVVLLALTATSYFTGGFHEKAPSASVYGGLGTANPAFVRWVTLDGLGGFF